MISDTLRSHVNFGKVVNVIAEKELLRLEKNESVKVELKNYSS